MDLDGIADPVTPRAFTPGDAMEGDATLLRLCAEFQGWL